MQTTEFDELVKRFHSVGHRYCSWAYDRWKQDIQSEAYLCAIQCQYLSYNEYPKEARRRIRKLLRDLGYHETNWEIYWSPRRLDMLESETCLSIEKLLELKRLYYEGKDYSFICRKYHINTTMQRIEVRRLLRKCFSRKYSPRITTKS